MGMGNMIDIKIAENPILSLSVGVRQSKILYLIDFLFRIKDGYYEAIQAACFLCQIKCFLLYN